MLLEFGCRMLHLVVFSTIGLALSPALSSSVLKQQENQNKGTLDREENMLEQTLGDLAPLLGLSDVKIQNDTTHQQNRHHGFQRPLPYTMQLYSPCTFPVPSTHIQRRQNQRQHDAISLACRGHKKAPFLCDLHKALNAKAVRSILQIYEKHKPVLHQEDGSESIFILIVRQLIQIYASALYNRWFRPIPKNNKGCNPKILALIVLENVLSNPRKVTSVNLHTGNHVFATFIANLQFETTNMLLQGIPIADVLKELLDQLGYALKEFHITKGRLRRYCIPPWAWKLGLASITLVFFSLVLEWVIVRRTDRKMRGYELGKIKAAIKGKTHMIF